MNPSMLGDLRHRLRALFRRDSVEREVDEELRFHLERDIEKRAAAGIPPAEAARQARLALGGLEQIKEECRDARGIALLESVLQDIGQGVRAMRRSPAFAATAVATIALSVAALAAVCTLAYSLLLRGLPADRPDELVDIGATRLPAARDGRAQERSARPLAPVSYPDYVIFRDRVTTLAGLAAHYPTAPLFVTVNGVGREINGAVVSANFFGLLGLRPALGRFFRDDEDRVPDRDRVAILGHDFWKTSFGASPSAIGGSVRVNGSDFTIIGVAPESFAGMTSDPIAIFLPTMMLRVGYRMCGDALAADCTILRMIGRVAPGRTMAEVAAELPTIMPAAWARARRGENSGVAVAAARAVEADGESERLVGILVAVAIVLLLVCCANLAALLSAQLAARTGELRMRLSLGASGGRIVRQLVTEFSIVAASGGVAGLVLSRLFVGALGAAFYSIDVEGHPRHLDVGLTAPIALGVVAVALAAGCACSMLPAFRAVRMRAPDAKRHGRSHWSSNAWLLGAQTAVALALIAVAGLLGASARTMLAGRQFETSHVALMRLRPRLVKYSPARAQRFQREAVERLEQIPGVESVSMVGLGIVLRGFTAAVSLPDWDTARPLTAGYNEIGPRYFETLRTPLVAGREFDERDAAGAPRVAIVNETLARRLWPEGSALDETLVVESVPRRVVGIVADVPMKSRAEPIEAFVYTPFWQNPAQVDSRLCIRVAGDPASMLPALVAAVNQVDPNVPVAETITLATQMKGIMRPVRVGATVVGYAAALAMLLTAIGLYGSLAFTVARRTREIGIRMALGAARAQVLGLVVQQGMTVLAPGVACGLALAWGGARVVRGLLYGSADAEWMIYLAAAAAIGSAGLLAAFLPARRAAAVEPLVALREN